MKGLLYSDSNGAVPISSAAITNTGAGTGVGTIALTLGATPSGVAETVHYAMSPKITSPSLDRVRGNIRDSRAEVARYDGRPLHGWAPSHRFPVTVV